MFSKSHHEPPPFPQLSLWTLYFCCVARRNCNKAICTKNSTLAKVQVCIFDPRGKKKRKPPPKKKWLLRPGGMGGSKAWRSHSRFFTSQKKNKHGFTCTLAQKLYRPQKNKILVFDSTPPPKRKKKSASNLACLLFKRTKIYETSHPLARFLHIPPTPIDPHNPLQTPVPFPPHISTSTWSP